MSLTPCIKLIQAAAARREADAERAWLRERRAEADRRVEAAEAAEVAARAAARCRCSGVWRMSISVFTVQAAPASASLRCRGVNRALGFAIGMRPAVHGTW